MEFLLYMFVGLIFGSALIIYFVGEPDSPSVPHGNALLFILLMGLLWPAMLICTCIWAFESRRHNR